MFTRPAGLPQPWGATSCARKAAALTYFSGDGAQGVEEPMHPQEEQYIHVDAHVLCTPVIADLDGDGSEDLVLAVSYFFDREYYDQYEHHHELGDDVDVTKYIAGAIVVYDLKSGKLKWSTHLDLSTEATQYRAYMYSR